MTTAAPVLLGPNLPDRSYRGGAGIAALRGIPLEDEYRSEDFVGSTTEVFAGGGVGLTALPDGRLLRDAVAAAPEDYLGARHVARFGASTELLVKLLDTAERLFVHFHPPRAFAERHLGLAHGKTEAWIVTAVRDVEADPAATRGDGTGYAYLGFSRPVQEVEAERWAAEQDVPDMLGAMHRLEVRAGSTLFVPAGLAHSIGPGITIVEVQEPTDLSVLLEYRGYRGLSEADAFLGLDRAVALGGLDRAAWSRERIEALASGRADAVVAEGVTRLLPEAADPYFRAERVTVDGAAVRLEPGFAIVVVLEGTGALESASGSLPLARGATALVPHASGPLEFGGSLTAIVCRPPAA